MSDTPEKSRQESSSSRVTTASVAALDRHDPEKDIMTPSVVTSEASHESQAPILGQLPAVAPVREPKPESEPVPELRNPLDDAGEGGVSYTNLKWWQAGMCMVAETISLGILALPKALSNLGLVIGILVLVLMGLGASYTGYAIGQFKWKYPHIHNLGDAGQVLFGRVGQEICFYGALGFIVFIMGSHILVFRLMMDVLTDYRFCGIVWTVVGLGVSFVATLPRTLKCVSYLALTSFVSILAAVFITIAAVVVQHPAETLVDGHFQVHMRLGPAPGLQFHDYFNSVLNITFAYAGHVAFFSFMSELKNPRDFPKALAFLQVADISMYIVTAVVIYRFAGDHVRSPAILSAGHLLRKIAFGVAGPTIVVAGVVNGHVAIKSLYVRVLRDRKHVMHQKGLEARGIWYCLTALLWLVAWLLAETIPGFHNIVGLTGALFASWSTFGLPGVFWLSLNVERSSGWLGLARKKPEKWRRRKWALLVLNVVNVVVGLVLCIVGIFASVRTLVAAGTGSLPFRCKHLQDL